MKLKDLQSLENIADRLSDERLDEIGADIVRDYESDLSTRGTWEKNNKEALELALQITKEKSWPWANAANIKFPLLTIASLQFASRVYPALVKAPDLVKFRPQGNDPGGIKASKAHRVSRHMSYQMLELDEAWEEQQDKAFFALPIIGSVFKKTYYDKVKGINCSEMVLANDLVIHYYAKSVEDAERITHRFRMSERKIKEKQLRGIYSKHKLAPASPQEPDQAEERQGITQPVGDSDVPRLLLDQYCYLDLDEDGYKEPYVVTVDKETKKVFRIVSRFKKVTTEQSLEIESIQKRIKDIVTSLPQQAETEQEVALIKRAEMTVQQLMQQIEDLTNEKPKVLSIEPMQHITKYGMIPSPDGGIYDIGFGALLSPLNNAVSTLINQLIDSGTLQNGSSGFIGRGARIKGGKLSFSPNEWKRVDVAGSVLRDSLVPLPVNQPSNVLFQLLGLLINYTERVSSVTDLMSGENPGQNTPAYNMSAMLEQGMQVFNGIFKRVYRSFRSEIRKWYELNALYMDEVEYFEYHDAEGEVYQSDYQGDSRDIIPAADPNAFAAKEKQAKAQMIAERAMVVPGYDPIKVEMRLLEAMDIPDSSDIFPVRQNEETGALELVFAPGPDPEFEIKRAEEQRRTMEAQDRAENNRIKAANDTSLTEAQVLKIMAEAEVAADKPELERLKLIQQRLAEQSKTLLEIAKIEEGRDTGMGAEPDND